MNLATSNSFIGLRDLTITYLVREMDKPLKQVLELSRDDILADRESALIGEHLVSNIPSFVCNYMHSRDNLFPGNKALFPTKDGKQYYPNQFAKRIRKLLAQADASVKPYHPKKLSIKQYKKLIGLRFGLQRHRYQMVLATALCANLGFRSSEVAGLKKSDIDFSLRVISLDDTKSQEDQESPLLSILFEPFRSFTERLSHNDHIFVNFSGNPWNRRHTRNAVQQYGEELGIIDLNHPPGRPISRILSGGRPACAIISLGCASRRTSTRSTRNSNGTSSPLFLFDLAPDGGCLAADIAARAGGLLHHLFTMTGARYQVPGVRC